MIPLSEKQAAKLADRTVVRVKFLKDDMTQSGDFSIVEIDGAKYGKIDFNKGVIRYASVSFPGNRTCNKYSHWIENSIVINCYKGILPDTF